MAIAPGGKPEDGAVVAWVARDGGNPQVHLSHVDAAGRRLGELQLTEVKGDASDVAVAWVGDGWVVGWVDGRDGNGEVYAAKVTPALEKAGREERITKAVGDAGSVSLAVKGDTVWVAWSDPRESPREGLSDVYATTLRARDAHKTGEDVRVLATAAHSRSPQIVPAGDGALVAWIEDVPTGLEGPGAAMLARLDGRAHVVGEPRSLALAARGRPMRRRALRRGRHHPRGPRSHGARRGHPRRDDPLCHGSRGASLAAARRGRVGLLRRRADAHRGGALLRRCRCDSLRPPRAARCDFPGVADATSPRLRPKGGQTELVASGASRS